MRTAREAVDPMALFLAPSFYQKWAEANHPHEPSMAEIEAMVSQMTKTERLVVSEKVQTILRIASQFQRALSTRH